jgi:hypothetical protein
MSHVKLWSALALGAVGMGGTPAALAGPVGPLPVEREHHTTSAGADAWVAASAARGGGTFIYDPSIAGGAEPRELAAGTNAIVPFIHSGADAVNRGLEDPSLGRLVLEARYAGTIEPGDDAGGFDHRSTRNGMWMRPSLSDPTAPNVVVAPLPAAAGVGLAVLSVMIGSQARRRRG